MKGSTVIGVFGGSGFYEFIDGAAPSPVATPFGAPAAVPMVGTVAGHDVAFIPRHGERHQFPPHLVPFRANVWAMRLLGVDRIVAPTAAGSLHPEWEPGHFAVPVQIVDRTWGRESTFVEGPDVRHLSFADPYDPTMRRLAVDGMRSTGATVHDGGTVVVIQGPRFSTRAESSSYAAAGWELINMTQMPEAALAAEAGICFVNISVITDYDVGVDGGAAVTHDEVLRRFAESLTTLKAGIAAMVPGLAAATLGCPEP
jgi:5'-methylthioadenosine phosphorylase